QSASGPVAVAVNGLRQPNEPGPFHPQHGHSATHGFELAGQIDPMQLLTNPPRQLRAIEKSPSDQALNPLHFGLGKIPTATSRGAGATTHGRWAFWLERWFHGSQRSRSSGGLRPFSAQARR